MSDEIKVKLILEAKQAQKDAQALAESFAKLTDDADAAAEAAKKYTDLVKKQAAEQEKAKKATEDFVDAFKKTAAEQGEAAQKRAEKAAAAEKKAADQAAAGLSKVNDKATELFQKGIGGGELAEKMRDVSRGFEIAGKSANSSSSRIAALAGALGIGARAAVGFAGQVVSAGDAVASFSREANHAAETPLSLWWDNAKRAVERFTQSAFRLGESLAAVHPGLRFIKAWAEGILTVMGYVGRAFDAVAETIDSLSHRTRVTKEQTGGFNAEAGQLAGKLSQVDVYSRAVKDSSQAMGNKFDVAQQAARGLADTLRSVKDAMNELSFATRRGEQETDSFTRAYRASLDAVVGAANERRNRRQVTRQLLAERRANGGRINGVAVSDADIRGVTGVAAGPDLRDLRGQVQEYRTREIMQLGQLQELERRRGESQEHYLNRELAHRRGIVDAIAAQRDAELNEASAAEESVRRGAVGALARLRDNPDRALFDAARAQSIQLRDRVAQGSRDAQFDNSFGGQVATQLGLVRNEQDNTLRATQTFAQQYGALMGGAFQTATSSFSAHIAALVEGRESAGEAFRGIVHETLMALAQQATVQALYQTAQGFAFLAMENYPGAAKAFTSAAIFAAVAAAGFAGGALTNAPAQGALPAGAGGGASAASRSARVPSSDNAGERSGGDTYVLISGDVFAGAAFQDFLHRGVRALDRRGLPAT